jgi:hypothetical protein
MNPFKIRYYTKKELALLYFPDSQPRTAVNHLMTWIRNCPQLREEFETTGYKVKNKDFTPRQVKAIVEQFGEP